MRQFATDTSPIIWALRATTMTKLLGAELPQETHMKADLRDGAGDHGAAYTQCQGSNILREHSRLPQHLFQDRIVVMQGASAKHERHDNQLQKFRTNEPGDIRSPSYACAHARCRSRLVIILMYCPKPTTRATSAKRLQQYRRYDSICFEAGIPKSYP